MTSQNPSLGRRLMVAAGVFIAAALIVAVVGGLVERGKDQFAQQAGDFNQHRLRRQRTAERRVDVERAHLDAAARGGWLRAWWPKRDPALAALRSDPRFTAWVARVEKAAAEAAARAPQE